MFDPTTLNPTLTYSTGKGLGFGNETLLQNHELCTKETCDLSMARYSYLPSLLGNATYLAIFAILIFPQILMGMRYGIWKYMLAMISGLVLEAIGYSGRILLYYDPFDNDAFLLNFIALTIGPAFFATAIYLCLGRVVLAYGEDVSRFRPRTYTIFFCLCDFGPLIMESAGVTIVSTSHTEKQTRIGKNIEMAGLISQVIALVLFATAATDFAIRARKAKSTWDERYQSVVKTPIFKAFLTSLGIATLTIFTRSIYRIIELSGGFTGSLFTGYEPIFMVFETFMIIIACTCLTVWHPALAFGDVWHQLNFDDGTEGPPKKMDEESGDEESQIGEKSVRVSIEEIGDAESQLGEKNVRVSMEKHGMRIQPS
ncbi:uncharacterized protein L3040_006967 [Drepanopeziza brunnea f. sp. 'multigermtubi']|uniref:RTA1 domain protein n=1 Tax=Marssonina brunnea f. sp. multigermtubi (strain MB_m1) TaxID=1072389 RepID=K1WVU9_MARBU|nr:uncharacterized protein MBM_09042 [Drepanopeziza brunnea f. sp. 'multigermtubi' MB_m1]EKD12813.1 hypothetical protein MBM_09042 [Drepanopeziza brunnea f. sp. 'multigermtubi' MB_m1]KAJ5038096.1 hypothetical protein L3040_006967 [Drepanopeziza brunnea f. sp. 'multigermtubi']